MEFLSTAIGEWLVPILRNYLGLAMNRAVETIIPAMFALALIGATSRILLVQPIRWDYALWGAIGTLIGGQLGLFLARRINERLLKQTFIYLMTLVGVHLIFQAI